jgi:hypothetical protein
MSSCALFPLFSKAAFLRIWQINFCESDQYVKCARFQAVCSGQSVAATLLPNGKHLPVVNNSNPPPESK